MARRGAGVKQVRALRSWTVSRGVAPPPWPWRCGFKIETAEAAGAGIRPRVHSAKQGAPWRGPSPYVPDFRSRIWPAVSLAEATQRSRAQHEDERVDAWNDHHRGGREVRNASSGVGGSASGPQAVHSRQLLRRTRNCLAAALREFGGRFGCGSRGAYGPISMSSPLIPRRSAVAPRCMEVG